MFVVALYLEPISNCLQKRGRGSAEQEGLTLVVKNQSSSRLLGS